MKNIFMLSALLVTSFFLVNCAKKSDSGNVGATATTASVCPTGYWYTNGTCTNGTNTINSSTTYSNGFYADNYSGTATLRITNTTKMKELYKLGMGVCDRAATNYGQANCDVYINGYTDVIIQFPPDGSTGTALVTIIAQPRYNPYVNYSFQLPSGGGLLGIALGYLTGYTLPDPKAYQGAYRDPLQIQMVVSPTNNNQGFEARGYGDYWTGLNQTVVSIQVPNGNTNSSTLNYNLLIGGVQAATGTMSRCKYYNCNL